MSGPKASDFVVGEYVKVVGPFSRDWKFAAKFIGWYGRVMPSADYRGRYVVVAFYPGDVGALFRPNTLERGCLTWEPEP